MEAIKISVDINVNLSEDTKLFFTNLFVSTNSTTQKPVEQKPVEQKPVEQKPVEQKPVEQKPVEQKLVQITIDDVRKILAEKVNSHRTAIKEKLTELGAPSVTKLNPESYEELYDFLLAL